MLPQRTVAAVDTLLIPETTMTTVERIDWTDSTEAAKAQAGNWRKFDSFVWRRRYDLEDADAWMVWYSSHRDSGILAQANERVINERLEPFTDGEDPDVVFERHSHWAVGFIDGVSLRTMKPDGTVTEAFQAFCKIMEDLDSYPVLDESLFSEMEYEATLENYASEIGHYRSGLPEGWESEVYSHFSDKGEDRYIESRDDQGGYCPRDKLVEALTELGLLQPKDE